MGIIVPYWSVIELNDKHSPILLCCLKSREFCDQTMQTFSNADQNVLKIHTRLENITNNTPSSILF